MIKLFFLTIFFFVGSYSLKAQEVRPWRDLANPEDWQTPVSDQEFKSELDNIKNPFEDGIPKPVVVINKSTHHGKPKPIDLHKPISKPVVPLRVSLPALNLQGVMVGEDMHQAIINDQVVPLHGTIKGARVDSVTKQGVELFFKGKKFFLKVD